MAFRNDDVNAEEEEEGRLFRAINDSNSRMKGKPPGSNAKNDYWVVKLINIPQGPGQVVTCKYNDSDVFISNGTEEPVNTELRIPIHPSICNNFSFHAAVFPWPAFTYNATGGTYLKFVLDGNKFEKAQQSSPFN